MAATTPPDFSTGHRLQTWWQQSAAPSLLAGASEAMLAAFEQQHGVILPADFRGYLACVNGFDQTQNHQDANGFSFWPLHTLARLSQYEGGRFAFADGVAYFLFCDYLDFSWAYAIALQPQRSHVVLVGTGDGQPQFVAESFGAFVDLYCRDDDALYASVS